jgi:hypothetical protein
MAGSSVTSASLDYWGCFLMSPKIADLLDNQSWLVHRPMSGAQSEN